MKSLPNVDAFKCLAKQEKQSMKKYVKIVSVKYSRSYDYKKKSNFNVELNNNFFINYRKD
jgi:hypothetical protein